VLRKTLKSFLAAALVACVFHPAFEGSPAVARQRPGAGNYRPVERGDKFFSERGKQQYPEKSWAKASAPEEFGYSSEKLKAAREFSKSIGSAAVLIVVDGVIVDEWGETGRKFNVHSIRKSFLSALYGIAVGEGRVKLSSTLAELGIDDNAPALTPAEKRARVIDLLRARSGVYHPALYETQWMKDGRPKRGSHPPGTFWYYNNWDFNALGTIYENSTKSSIAEEFRKRIAGPLQMEDFRVEDVEYVRGADSIHPAYPFRMTARDMARFGLLYLREGAWRGRQVISKKWVQESTAPYSEGEERGGYGFLWWVAIDGRLFPGVRLDEAYAANGAGGHYILVVPKFNLVIVHRVNTDVAGREVTAKQFGDLVKLIVDARESKE
jgi:CubicO group peptidase (beta-lactamase class C family)